MTEQEALERVVEHAQLKEKAVTGVGQPTYWTAEGRRCFLGCLLTEREAQMATEVHAPSSRVARRLGLSADFASELMDVHDTMEPERWVGGLQELARDWGLRFPTTRQGG